MAMSPRPAPLIPVPVDDPLTMAWFDCNDLGNAERLVRLAKGLMLWVDDIGWIAYDGQRWSRRDGGRRAQLLANEVARHIDREAAALAAIADSAEKLEAAFDYAIDPEVAQERVTALRKHAVKSGNTAQTTGMLSQARALMTAQREDFDQDPYAFNVQNGTLRFHFTAGSGWSARLDAHEPRDMIMQVARFTYAPKAKCPQWLERLKLIQPDHGAREQLRGLYGYAILGLRSLQQWFIHQGRGGDGKSLTNFVIGEGMGDYYRHADVASFLKGAMKSGSDHSSDMARLQGDIRFVSFDEPPKTATWNSSRLKQITGGKVTCRALREAEIEYVPRYVLMGEVNPLPAVDADDDGFWRRCQLVPWPYQFNKGGEKAEPWDLLVERFTEEWSGILNWLIEGALGFLETRALPASQPSIDAVAEYKQSASPFGEWLNDRCDLSDRTVRTQTSVLFGDYKSWCEEAGHEKPPTSTAFGKQMRDRQFKEWKSPVGGVRHRTGIKLKSDWAGHGDGAPSAQGMGGGENHAGDRREPARDWAPEAYGGFDEDDRP